MNGRTELPSAETPAAGSPSIGLPTAPAPNERIPFHAYLIAALIQAALITILFFIAQPVPKKSPTLEVALRPEPKEEQIENEVMEKVTVQINSGGASSGMIQPVVSMATSQISITLPDFAMPSSGENPGMDIGIQPGSSFGSGFGAGAGAGRGFPESAMVTANIGNMEVKAANLGVILDVSGSMQDYLRDVRRELRRSFRSAPTIEVVGCSLVWDGAPQGEGEEEKKTVRFQREADTVLDAVEMLIADKECDAIFWFSDLADIRQPDALLRLEYLLGTFDGSDRRRPVRFYVRSVNFNADPPLTDICERSGGAVAMQKPE